MMLRDPDLRNRLAAEYVLGTMQGAARRRFEEYVRQDATLQQVVASWEGHLLPLVAKIAPIEPPSRVWSRIEARLGHIATTNIPTNTPATQQASFWQSLVFWRNFGLGASALASALLVAVFLTNPVERAPMLTAVLAEDTNVARVFIEQPRANMLTVKMIKPWKTNTGKSHELWVIPKDGTPRSLGLINDATDTEIALAGRESKLTDGTMFAVSVEPMGGSTTGAPSGQIACKGSIAWMPPKSGTVRSQI